MKDTLENIIEENIKNEKNSVLYNIIGCIIGIFIFFIGILIVNYTIKTELVQASDNVVEHVYLISNVVPFYLALGTLIYCLIGNIIEYYNL